MVDSNDIVKKLLAFFACMFLVFGTLTNSVSCYICLRKPLRDTPTFVFMAFMVVSDTVALYGLNLDWYFYRAFFPTYLSDKSWFYCKIHYFIHLFPLKTSAWLLVSMSIEAFLSVRIPVWRLTLFNSKKAAIVSALITLIFFAIDFRVNFITEFQTTEVFDERINATVNATLCYTFDDLFTKWLTINTYGYSIIPFILLAVFNSLLLYRTYTHKTLTSCQLQKRHLRSMTTLIMVRTLLFIICTFPVAVAGGYFLAELRSTDHGFVWLSFFNFLRFSQHSFNIIVLTVFNHKFRDEVYTIRASRIKAFQLATSQISLQNFSNILKGGNKNTTEA